MEPETGGTPQPLFTGERGCYRWLERTEGFLWDVLEVAPEVVEGRYVGVTASDSGPMRVSPARAAHGWRRHGALAVSPRITDAEQVPTDLYHEWYIFETPVVFDDYEVFVNYGAFSLHHPQHRPLQERFWSQIERIGPESYLAEGDNLIWVTQDVGLYERVTRALRAQT